MGTPATPFGSTTSAAYGPPRATPRSHWPAPTDHSRGIREVRNRRRHRRGHRDGDGPAVAGGRLREAEGRCEERIPAQREETGTPASRGRLWWRSTRVPWTARTSPPPRPPPWYRAPAGCAAVRG